VKETYHVYRNALKFNKKLVFSSKIKWNIREFYYNTPQWLENYKKIQNIEKFEKLLFSILKFENQVIYLRYVEVAVLSGKTYLKRPVTGLDSLFYPDLRKTDFGGIFLNMCEIGFWIRISFWKFPLF